jgi:hypothetical protein
MQRPEIIYQWNMPDLKEFVSGWHVKEAVDITEDNFYYLLERHNELVKLVLLLADSAGVEFDEQEEE